MGLRLCPAVAGPPAPLPQPSSVGRKPGGSGGYRGSLRVSGHGHGPAGLPGPAPSCPCATSRRGTGEPLPGLLPPASPCPAPTQRERGPTFPPHGPPPPKGARSPDLPCRRRGTRSQARPRQLPASHSLRPALRCLADVDRKWWGWDVETGRSRGESDAGVLWRAVGQELPGRDAGEVQTAPVPALRAYHKQEGEQVTAGGHQELHSGRPAKPGACPSPALGAGRPQGAARGSRCPTPPQLAPSSARQTLASSTRSPPRSLPPAASRRLPLALAQTQETGTVRVRPRGAAKGAAAPARAGAGGRQPLQRQPKQPGQLPGTKQRFPLDPQPLSPLLGPTSRGSCVRLREPERSATDVARTGPSPATATSRAAQVVYLRT